MILADRFSTIPLAIALIANSFNVSACKKTIASSFSVLNLPTLGIGFS